MIQGERAALSALLRLLAVAAVMLAGVVWWQAAKAPDYRADMRLRLTPANAPPQHPGILYDDERRAGWEVRVGKPIRFPVTSPDDRPVLRFHESYIEGHPDVAVRIVREDGRRDDVWQSPATEGHWTQRRVELPLDAGEAADIELLALDGRGRAGIGAVHLADVVLESAGRPVDETEMDVVSRKVARDLLVDHGGLRSSAPAGPERAEVAMPGPPCVLLDRHQPLWVEIDGVPPGGRLEVVVHARPSWGTTASTPGRVSVVTGTGDELLALDVDVRAAETLLSADLSNRVGERLDIGFRLEGSQNMFVGLREAYVTARRRVERRVFEAGRSVNVLLVVVESLRPDRLGAYGYASAKTPNIDALAARGGRWERAYAPSSWSVPSLASLLTGTSPLTHGVGTRRGVVLSPRTVTLAQSAAWAGFSTAVFSASPAISSASGLDHGYETKVIQDLPAEILVEHFADWLHEHQRFEWFATVLLDDTAHPLDPALRDLATVGAEPDPGVVERLRRVDGRPGAAEALAREVGTFYDAEVSGLDRALGALFAGLDEAGMTEHTLVVLVGSHGEEFYEHGGRLNGRTLFDEVVRVPLIVAGPGVRGAPFVAVDPVEMVDVTRLLGQLGRLIAGPTLQGRVPMPLGPATFDEPTLCSVLFPFPGFGTERLDAVRRGSLLLVVNRDDGTRALYDIDEDPLELVDLISTGDGEALGTADALEAQLVEWKRTSLLAAASWPELQR